MADPVTLFILVAAGERPDLTRAMASATHDALGSSSVVVVREVPEPSDTEALATERSENADAVVELSWTDAHHEQASVKMHIARDRRWVERSIGFLRLDADAERGRTLGFTIASILPQTAIATPMGSAPTGAGTSTPVSGPTGADTVPVPLPTLPPSTTGTGPAAIPRPVAPSTAAPRPDFALDVLGLGEIGGGGDWGAGGGAAAQWFPIRNLSVRLAGGLRAGSIDAAHATTLTLFASGGMAFHPWRTSLAHPFGASFRAEFLFLDESVTYSGHTEYRRLPRLGGGVPGLALGVDGSWRFATNVELVAGVGIEGVFLTTYVDVPGARQTTLGPWSAIGETGMRFDF
jgi:hypothetical protein